MTIYQAMQLNAAGSKSLIKNSHSRRESVKWGFVYLLKVILTVAFCFVFVTCFSLLFGSENSIAGVVVLLILLLVRQSDFGMNMPGSMLALFLLFAILCVSPMAASLLSPFPAFLVHLLSIFAITLLGCHNIIMCNHFTFVLGYLLLFGYPVTGNSYICRLKALLLGYMICAAVYWIRHRNHHFRRGFFHLLEEFHLHSSRSQWQLRISLATSSAMLLTTCMGLPRAMWVGIACMSIMAPFITDCTYRELRRAPFNIAGCLLFILLYHALPKNLHPFLGILGGIGVGFSAKYSFQNIFNVLGALIIATDLFGLYPAVLIRIAANLMATFYCIGFNILWEHVRHKLQSVRQPA
ncbi:FUSC family protein [Luxibacter massiliensis]|uniref:FUSC family protein n=1 Tax=Luxibacter massiliensis TaxID=2219695 RepID=UPI000F058D55|nr:FUSC family protein [Luxibacter massiliensis]